MARGISGGKRREIEGGEYLRKAVAMCGQREVGVWRREEGVEE